MFSILIIFIMFSQFDYSDQSDIDNDKISNDTNTVVVNSTMSRNVMVTPSPRPHYALLNVGERPHNRILPERKYIIDLTNNATLYLDDFTGISLVLRNNTLKTIIFKNQVVYEVADFWKILLSNLTLDHSNLIKLILNNQDRMLQDTIIEDILQGAFDKQSYTVRSLLKLYQEEPNVHIRNDTFLIKLIYFVLNGDKDILKVFVREFRKWFAGYDDKGYVVNNLISVNDYLTYVSKTENQKFKDYVEKMGDGI